MKRHVPATIAVTLAVAAAAGAAMPEKKVVYYGWDVGEASLETVFSNADKFAETGLDGIALSIKGNRMGQPRKSQTRDFAFTDPPWTKGEFARQVELLRELTARPGLRHCYLQVDWSQPKRLRLGRSRTVPGLHAARGRLAPRHNRRARPAQCGHHDAPPQPEAQGRRRSDIVPQRGDLPARLKQNFAPAA